MKATKNENVDLEKQVNNSPIKPLYKLFVTISLLVFLMNTASLSAQEVDFIPGKQYTIDSIEVKGLKSFNAKTVISYSGLRRGQRLRLPGDKVSSIINKLWNLDLFSDINFYATNVTENSITLEIEIEELPTLNQVKINGLKKGKIPSILKDTELEKGKKIIRKFLDKYQELFNQQIQKRRLSQYKSYAENNPRLNPNQRPQYVGKY